MKNNLFLGLSAMPKMAFVASFSFFSNGEGSGVSAHIAKAGVIKVSVRAVGEANQRRSAVKAVRAWTKRPFFHENIVAFTAGLDWLGLNWWVEVEVEVEVRLC